LFPQPIASQNRELRSMGYDPGQQDAFRVNIFDLTISPGALQSIVSGIEDIARAYHKPVTELRGQIFDRIYWLNFSESLVMVLDVSSMDSYVFIEVPSDHWGFKERSARTH
jgi:hypothetical protein